MEEKKGFIQKIVEAICENELMSGKKSYLGGLLMIGGTVVTVLFPEYAPEATNAIVLGAGLLGIGIAHKVDKQMIE